jgi:hypothetical protein
MSQADREAVLRAIEEARTLVDSLQAAEGHPVDQVVVLVHWHLALAQAALAG